MGSRTLTLLLYYMTPVALVIKGVIYGHVHTVLDLLTIDIELEVHV